VTAFAAAFSVCARQFAEIERRRVADMSAFSFFPGARRATAFAFPARGAAAPCGAA